MTWVAVGVGAAGVAGAAIQADAAKDAAKTQSDAAYAGIAADAKQQRVADARALPYSTSGQLALNQLTYLMGLGSADNPIKTQDNFDPQKYRNWLLSRKVEEIKQKTSDPKKIEAGTLKWAKEIDEALDKTDAWAHYQDRIRYGRSAEGDFWGDLGRNKAATGAGQPNQFGFLQQRFNNQLFEQDPGYQWRKQEGADAVQGSVAAKGGLLSGAALKAMERYGQEFAANEYQNAYARFNSDQQNLYNRLAGISGTGQQQMNTQNAMQANSVANQNALMLQGANAQAAGQMARASGYQNVGNTILSGIATYRANKG